MKLTNSFLLPIFIGAASAVTNASVYIFEAAIRSSTSPPSLTPEQARLVFAQRLGVSQYHGIGDASDATLSYVNKFGGQYEPLFQDKTEVEVAELVLIVEGVSFETGELLLKKWSAIEPAFTISHPPSGLANKQLVFDLQKQSGHDKYNCSPRNAVNPFDTNCWNGRSNAIYFDLATKGESQIDELMEAQERFAQFAHKAEMNVLVVLMPQSSRTSKSSSKPYGSYDVPTQVSFGKVRRQAAEEPITEAPVASTPPTFNSKQLQPFNSSSNSTFKQLPKLPPLCHTSKDSCESSTNSCSGRGTCFKKYSTSKADCFTCGCSRESFVFGGKKYFRESSWGGSACHKQDVSGPFWLIGLFTVVIVGIVSWGIGLMYSIGEEKLPGVIGAGVSSKTR
ncbi:hypothetical protein ONS95_012244 [Cadophora gregata]|uniref:uncharacterized protein n=1 Tax=Cadophora gregata TaxID=51156 RepID=UPI0026DB2393|nr:uncharacterized protein ONS95_012244 [Cadophora gregata]KAK0117932.1 hypothetical protein ONS95_012244 [Cadophora gregata]KAK0122995.1 hypothetical protein ONS96_010009 [Cadophora gregata f. sp. sojae]